MGAHVWMGDTASDWYIVQDHTDRIIDQWSNLPTDSNPTVRSPTSTTGPKNPPRAGAQTRRDSSHDNSLRPDGTRASALLPQAVRRATEAARRSVVCG